MQLLKRKKQQAEPDSIGASRSSAGSQLSEDWIHLPPRSGYKFGRRIACHFDEDSIQLAVASWFGSRRTLIDVRKVYLTSDLESDESKADFIAKAICAYVSKYGGRSPSVRLCVAGSETALRTTTIPELTRGRLASALQFEARKRLPFPTDDCEFDWRVTARSSKSPSPMLRTSIIGATRRLLDDRLAVFDGLGVEVSQIYFAQDVVGHLLSYIEDFDQQKPYALINIERNSTGISYYVGTSLEFSNTANLGSSFLNRRSDPTIFEYFGESLVEEIQNSLDYYTGQFSRHFSNEIYVYGDLAYTDDLIDLLSDRFGFRFKRFPTSNFDFVSSNQDVFEMALPVCLPVAAAAVCPLNLCNLLPADRKEKQQLRRTNRYGLAGLTILALALLTSWFALQLRVHSYEDTLAMLSQQAESFRNSAPYDSYNMIKRQMATEQTYLDRIKPNPSYLGLNLKELSRLTTSSIRLHGLEFAPQLTTGNLQLHGVIRHASIPPEILLAEYVAALNSSAYYSDFTVLRHHKGRSGGYWELDFQLIGMGTI